MSFVSSGSYELSQLMSNHILGYIYRNVLSTIMHSDCMSNHLRENGGAAGPGLDNLLLSSLVHSINFFQ